jgi:hypothetical protein
MAQADYVVANGTGAAVRSDLNGQLAAIVSNNSGATEPATMYAYQWWADTTAGLLKLRNSANNAWITLRELDGTLLMEDGTAAAPGLSFASDPDSGIFRGGANEFGIATNGVERVEFGTSEVVFNDGGANYDFRIEGDTNTSLFFVDASAEAVGIGTASPGAKLHVNPGSGNKGDIYLDYGTGSTADGRLVIEAGASAVLYETIKSGGLPQAWYVTGSERMRIDSGGRLLIGTSTSDAQRTAAMQIASAGGLSGWGSSASLSEFGTSYNPWIVLQRSRNGTVGSHTVVSNGDILGGIQFTGSDGDSFEPAAWIKAEVDGTPGNGDMPGRIVLATTADGASSPTERMRITQAGLVMINGTTATAGSQPVVFQVGESTDYFHIQRSGPSSVIETQVSVSTTDARNIFAFKNPNGFTGYIQISGTSTSFLTSSDYRLKENVTAVTDGISRLQRLKPSRFNFIADPNTTVDGFLAHEVQAIVPEAISGIKDEVDADGNPKYQGIDQSKLVPLLVAALQEAIGRIETLEAKVVALEAA